MFTWQYVIFFIPIILAILFLIGTALGLGDFDLDGDADIDVDVDDLDVDGDVDTDVEAENTWGHNILDLLGFRRCPMSIVIMIWLMLFGVIGVASNMLFGIGSLTISLLIVAGAFVSASVLTRILASVIGRIIPKDESYTISKYDLLEQPGIAASRITSSSGFADIRDHEGNLHQIQCRTLDCDVIKRGDKIRVIDFSEDEGYTVDRTFEK